ncbi:MAG: formate--tetrahydrofolate ligase [Burkholderiales bacterium]|nr:formate--tetrahydrofolate ligase [Burkholderiales bacterium]
MLSDIEIAQQAKIIPIDQLAKSIGLKEEEYFPYGRDKAKVQIDTSSPKGKLILVTATSGTPAGSGKTTTSIALAQAFKKMGEKPCLALREPSLGPCFGLKGGAAGGGYSQVLPMESINLHFTGDFHAITAANNLLAALIDNAIHQGQVELKEVSWKRALDVNDRSLRDIVTGLGGIANGKPAQTGCDITAASELMAILCLANGEEDLRKRLDNIVLGIKKDGTAFTGKELGGTGALMALLKDALLPNLVQSIEGVPAFVHGGPFANIAHGCNSVQATKAALQLSDWTITEAGFGSDLGAEKFYDIKCRTTGLQPDATVLVTSLNTLKWHGGVDLKETRKPNMEALKKGIPNLEAHIKNLQNFGQQVVVALNHFAGDSEEEIDFVKNIVEALGARFAITKGFAEGGKGAIELANQVKEAVKEGSKPLTYAYDLDDPLIEKIKKINRRVYGGKDIQLSAAAQKDLKNIEALGYGKLPVCIAKTQFSLSHEPSWKGAPKDFTLPVQRLLLNAGAGFIVATTGAIVRMPGLPKKPAAYSINVKDGKITGLS